MRLEDMSKGQREVKILLHFVRSPSRHRPLLKAEGAPLTNKNLGKEGRKKKLVGKERKGRPLMHY